MKKKRNKGITLISLVITIIVLLILAGITINLTIGEKGIFRMAETAGRNYAKATDDEQKDMNEFLQEADNIVKDIEKDREMIEPTEVWWKIDGTTLYFNNSQKNETYKKAEDDYFSNWETEIDKFPEWAGEWDFSTNAMQYSPITTVKIENKIAPTNTVGWFYGMNRLTEIIDIGNLNTCNVTDMTSMFDHCEILAKLDVSEFDTRNVKDMRRMFATCYELEDIDVSGFNTSNVENMDLMFYDLYKVSKIDVSHFNTNKVKSMSAMFTKCKKVKELDVSKFDTTNVIFMDRMFAMCYELESLEVNQFDTVNVIDVDAMFYQCTKLRSLDISNWDTNKVRNMNEVFAGCSNLASILVGEKWKVVENAIDMFKNCGVSNVTVKNN